MSNIYTFSFSTLSKRSFAFKKKFRLENFWVSSFFVVVALLSFCAFQVLKQAKMSYFIGTYERNIEKISQKNNELQILISQQNSLKDLKQVAEHFKFEPIGRVHYVKILGSVAVKQ